MNAAIQLQRQQEAARRAAAAGSRTAGGGSTEARRKQAKDAKRQACINRISGTRNHCVRRGKWVGGSAGWCIHNRCGEPTAVLIDHRDGRGFANLGHIRPYGFINTRWRDEEGKKKELAFQACYHSGGIFVRPTGCEVKSWACVEGNADNP